MKSIKLAGIQGNGHHVRLFTNYFNFNPHLFSLISNILNSPTTK